MCISCQATGAWEPPQARIFEEPPPPVVSAERPTSDWDQEDPGHGADRALEPVGGDLGVSVGVGEGEAGPSPRRRPVDAGRLIAVEGEPLLDGLAADLEALRSEGIEVLRGRPWLGSAGTDEEIAVAPSGVWVIDLVPAERAAALERDFLSGTDGAEILNALGGRVTVVAALIPEGERLITPVRGALCLEDATPEWFPGVFHLAGIAVTDRHHLAELLLAPEIMDLEHRQRTAEALAGKI